MAQRVHTIDVDLNQPLKMTQLPGIMATGDRYADVIRVRAFRGKEPVELSGEVFGYVIDPVGGTHDVTDGIISGNVAQIQLPDTAYQMQGQIQIAVRLVDGDVKTVLAAAVCSVIVTKTDEEYAPGVVIPSVEDLLTHLAEVDAAATSARNAAASVGQYSQTLIVDNSYDFIRANLNTGSDSADQLRNVTFTFADDGSLPNAKCTISSDGASVSTAAYKYIYRNRSALPTGMRSGKSYQIRFQSTGTRVTFSFLMYTSTTNFIEARFTDDEAWLTVPENVIGLAVRLLVLAGTAVNETVTRFEVLSAKTNDSLDAEIEQAKKITYDNIGEDRLTPNLITAPVSSDVTDEATFDWNEDTGKFVVNLSQTATVVNYHYIYSRTRGTKDFYPGELVNVRFSAPEGVSLLILLYELGIDSYTTAVKFTEDGWLQLPATFSGMAIRIQCEVGANQSGIVTDLRLLHGLKTTEVDAKTDKLHDALGLIYTNWESGRYTTADGTPYVVEGYARSKNDEPIAVTPGDAIFATATEGFWWQFRFYDADMAFVEGFDHNTHASIEQAVPGGAVWMKYAITNTNHTLTVEDGKKVTICKESGALYAIANAIHNLTS